MRMLVLATALLVGCSDDDREQTCPPQAVSTITLRIATAADCSTVTVVLRKDGTVFSTSSAGVSPTAPDKCTFYGANNQTGTFSAEITAPKHRPVTVEGLVVETTRGGCVVKTAQRDVTLERE